MRWSRYSTQEWNFRSWVAWLERMALLGKEVGRGKGGTSAIAAKWSTNACPCDRPPTLDIPLTQKGLNLGTNILDAEVVYVF